MGTQGGFGEDLPTSEWPRHTDPPNEDVVDDLLPFEVPGTLSEDPGLDSKA